MKVLVLVLILVMGAFFVGRYESGEAEPGITGTPSPTPYQHTFYQDIALGTRVTCQQPECQGFHVKPYVANDPTCDGVSNESDVLAMLQQLAGIPYAPPHGPLYFCDGQFPDAATFEVVVIAPSPVPH